MTFKEWYEFNKNIFLEPIEKFAISVRDKDSGNVIFEGQSNNYEINFLLGVFGKYEMQKCLVSYSDYNSLIIILLNEIKEENKNEK